MPYKKYNWANNAICALSLPISDSDLSLVLKGNYWRLPTSNFIIKITKSSGWVVTARENIYVTTRTGANCTGLTRAYEPVPVSDAAATATQVAQNFATDDVVEVAMSEEFFSDIQVEMDNKLPIVWGLNTGYGTNKVKEVDPTTWADVLRTRSTSASIVSTSLLQFRDAASRNVTETPYSSILTDIAATSSRLFSWIAWEAFSANEFGCKEMYSNFVQCAVGWLSFNNDTIGQFGQNAARTRKAFRIIWNWVLFTNFKMALNKAWTPWDNVTVRIETDAWWVPSWTLFTANANATIAWWTLSTWSTDQTITMAWNVTLTAWQVLWIVLARSGAIDAANYYYVCGLQRQSRAFTMSTHNGTSWAAATTNQNVYLSCTGVYSEVLVKTNATYVEHSYPVWYAAAAAAVWAWISLNQGWISSVFSGLTRNSTYYLSNTPWAISTTPWTQVRKVWYTPNSTSVIIFYLPEDNVSLSVIRGAITYTTLATIANPLPLLCVIREPTSIVVSGTLSQYWINGVTRTAWVAYDVVPWDVVTAFPSSWNVTLWVAQKPTPTLEFLNT